MATREKILVTTSTVLDTSLWLQGSMEVSSEEKACTLMEYSIIASIVFHLLFLYWHMEKVNLVF